MDDRSPPLQLLVVAALGILVASLGVGPGSAAQPLPSDRLIAVPLEVSAEPGPLTIEGTGLGDIPLSQEEVALLPEARYDAVIAGLIGYSSASPPMEMGVSYTLRADTPIYGAARLAPVARIDALNFLGEKTVVVPVSFFQGWALILTPARQTLPSAARGLAPAQTAGWVRADDLAIHQIVTHRIVVSVSQQSLRIVDREGTDTAVFSIGVGTPSTPTPTGVTGYIQARYLDPAQGQSTHPIVLTSLHSAAADEPYSGTDGGLIGLHFFSASSGAVSHGCLRLSEDAIAAVNQLPIGTSISILE